MPYYGREVQVVEMDGKLTDINDYAKVEPVFKATAAKSATELSAELIKVRTKISYIFPTFLF